MPDEGDPRFAAPIWTGLYNLTAENGASFDSTVVMLSKQNMVQFLSDANNVTADTVFATLPDECVPDYEVMVPVVVTETVTVTAETGNPYIAFVDLDEAGIPFNAWGGEYVNTAFPQRASGSLAVLTVSPVGELKCSQGGTVHLNGINFHICANYYSGGLG